MESVPLDQMGKDDSIEYARQIVEDFARQRCNVALDPLFRLKIVELSENEHVFAWGIHHIISDAFSLNLLFEEIWSIYKSFLGFQVPRLQRRGKSYLEYAVWQQDQSANWAEEHGQYWEEVVSGTDRLRWPSPASVPHDGDEQKPGGLAIVPLVYANLSALARHLHTTVPLVILSAYALLVARWCTQQCILVPVNNSGRTRPEHRCMVGYLAQFLCVRVDLRGRKTFRDLLCGVNREYQCAMSHQDFGRVLTKEPVRLCDGYFSWLPWAWDQIIGMPSPRYCEEVGIQVSQFPFAHADVGESWENRGIGVVFLPKKDTTEGELIFDPKFMPANVAGVFGRELVRIFEEIAIDPDIELVKLV